MDWQCFQSSLLQTRRVWSSPSRRHHQTKGQCDENHVRLRRQQESASNWYCPIISGLATRLDLFSRAVRTRIVTCCIVLEHAYLEKLCYLLLLLIQDCIIVLMMIQVLRFLLSSDRCVRSEHFIVHVNRCRKFFENVPLDACYALVIITIRIDSRDGKLVIVLVH